MIVPFLLMSNFYGSCFCLRVKIRVVILGRFEVKFKIRNKDIKFLRFFFSITFEVLFLKNNFEI